MTSIATVIVVMVLGGLFGGVAAYLVDAAGRKDSVPLAGEIAGIKDYALLRFLVLGLIAAATVPLFLSLVKSGLMQTIFRPAQPLVAPYEDFLIFAGMCLIAAFYARTFIDSVSKQVLRKVESAEEKANVAAKTASEAKKVAAETASEVESIDANAGQPEIVNRVALEATTTGEAPDLQLTDVERRVLAAMGTKTYRTRTGIAEDSAVSRNRISEVLDGLHARKLALPTTSPTTGGARWTISKAGQDALAAQ